VGARCANWQRLALRMPAPISSYETWNRLLAVPLLVLLTASVLGALRDRRLPVRLGLVVTSIGLAVGLTGIVLEVWVAGGIRTGTGDRDRR
jgi:hypothetical protein